ncbi:hypothetical protein E2C01_009881 [Portunus trituberculatus]|uniref:Uncharacterized protein n=1 Tax=Portunus trituberculatus TaxID=210409 RepID=A0A5B7D776_PORTR|nr:hypothetical protein [Portunus trituberculatus]
MEDEGGAACVGGLRKGWVWGSKGQEGEAREEAEHYLPKYKTVSRVQGCLVARTVKRLGILRMLTGANPGACPQGHVALLRRDVMSPCTCFWSLKDRDKQTSHHAASHLENGNKGSNKEVLLGGTPPPRRSAALTEGRTGRGNEELRVATHLRLIAVDVTVLSHPGLPPAGTDLSGLPTSFLPLSLPSSLPYRICFGLYRITENNLTG